MFLRYVQNKISNSILKAEIKAARPIGLSQKWHFVLRAKAVSIVLLAVLFSAAIAGAEFYSKEQYEFQTDYNDDYEYQWSSSAGAYLENNEDIFNWTAPDVNMPEDVEISVLVTDRSCGCQSKFEKTIKVIPSEDSPTEEVIYLNSTNFNQSDNDTEILSVLSGDHENSTEVLALEDAKKRYEYRCHSGNAGKCIRDELN